MAAPRPRLIFVSNFSKPGRGTHIVGPQVANIPSFEVIRFDAMDERGARGPMITLHAVLALARQLILHPRALVLVDTGQGLRLLRIMAALFPFRTFVARYGNIFHGRAPQGPGRWKARLKRRLYEAAIRKAGHIIVPSSAARDALVNAGIKAADAVSVIPNGRDFAPVPGVEFDPALPVRLRFVGRLDGRKSPQTAIETLAILTGTYGLDARLDLLGEGPDRAGMEQLASARGVGGKVVFHGMVANPWAGLAPNTILLHPARYEGFGYVVMEAIAHGAPCLAFAGVGGPEEIITATGGGLIIQERSAGAMAAGVVALLSDPASLRIQAAAARAAVRTRYGSEAMIAGYDEILLRLAKDAGRIH